jgi:hypothetical protein
MSMLEEIHDGLQSLHIDTLTLNPTKVNWVERWSKDKNLLAIPKTCKLKLENTIGKMAEWFKDNLAYKAQNMRIVY